MKQHVQMFESFMDFGMPDRDFESPKGYHSREEMPMGRDMEDSGARRATAAKTSMLIGELTRLANEFDVSSPEVKMGAMPFLTKYLTSRGVDEEEVETFVKVLGRLSFRANEKKKVDQDGDGDTDFVDAKIAQYKKGGIPKDAAVKKAKLFAKKNNIADSKNSKKP